MYTNSFTKSKKTVSTPSKKLMVNFNKVNIFVVCIKPKCRTKFTPDFSSFLNIQELLLITNKIVNLGTNSAHQCWVQIICSTKLRLQTNCCGQVYINLVYRSPLSSNYSSFECLSEPPQCLINAAVWQMLNKKQQNLLNLVLKKGSFCTIHLF